VGVLVRVSVGALKKVKLIRKYLNPCLNLQIHTKMKWQDDIVSKFVQEISLTKQFTDSFNDFSSYRIREIISLLPPIKASYFTDEGERTISLSLLGGRLMSPVMLEKDGSVRVEGDKIYPQECRLRNITYAGPLYIDVEVKRSNAPDTVIKDVYIGRIPIMLFSDLCHLSNPADRVKHGECDKDPGGYVIVNGNEKSLVSQKTCTHNRMNTYARDGGFKTSVRSERNRRVHVTTIKYKPNHPLTCTFPRLVEEVPLITLLMAMDVDVLSMRSLFDAEENALLEASYQNLPEDKNEARKRLHIREVYNVGDSEDNRLQNALDNVLIPHMKPEKKALFLICMVQELMGVATGKLQPTDRDSLSNQRIETSSSLMSTLFLHLMIKMSNDIRLLCQKSLPKLKRGITDDKIRTWISRSNSITDGFQYSLATGNWNTTFVDRQQRKGVAQALQRLTYISTMSQLRRVSSSMEKTQKLPKPRYLHGSHFGRFCPAETPEGAPCGLENQLTVQSYISLKREPQAIRRIIQQYLLESTVENMGKTKVFLNGVYEGSTIETKRLVDTVRHTRRSGQFAKDMSVSYQPWRDAVHISTTAGRVCRPLLIVNDGTCVYETVKDVGKMSFNQMLENGIIEYLDCEEEDTMFVSFFVKDLTKKHSHCEISNAQMYGLCSATIPFSDRNPGTRNTYQNAMAKQATGVNASNYQTRMDTTTHILQYGQKPIVSTRLANEYGVHELPTGINAIVAIMSFTYNQEDSIIVNQSALDRGFARADTYKTLRDSLSGKDDALFKRPSKKKRVGKYNMLEEDGLLRPGVRIKAGDCVIGKESKEEDNSQLSRVDGTVDDVLMYQERNGDRAVKVKVRQTRIPVIGDKFSSRHGQKGTIGLLVQQEDLPWTIDGIVPDIIINPHAIPSRMTVGHLVECLTGKVGAIRGTFEDASPFNGRKVGDVMKELKEAGFSSKGNETLYSGTTGEQIKAEIFMGPTFYQRLKHNVEDKIHARSRGKRNALTNQPNGGRKSEGGLRIGEMEKDAFNSHGVPFVINERMCVSSDAYKMKIEGKDVVVPYASKLLWQELASMGIRTKIKLKQ